MADFGTQTDLEPPLPIFVPAPRIIELNEMTKPSVSKASRVISLLLEVDLNPKQRKAPSRSFVRNNAEITPPGTASQPQASVDLPSPAKPKRARITAKREKEECTLVEPVLRGVGGPVGRVL